MNDKFLNISIDDLSNSFSEISDCIKKYYPIGITREDENYFSYSGIVALNEIIKKNDEKEWNNSLLEKLKLDFHDISETTAGLVPNFSGVIRLNNTSESRTELHFYKSLIGNYFTIEVLENMHIKEISHPVFGKRKTWAIENIIVSPVGEYEEIFLKVYQSIVGKYKGVKFLPYIFDLYKINNLVLPYKSNNEVVTIAGAFFQKFSSYEKSITIIGDINYQIDRLKKDGDNGQLAQTSHS